MKSIKFILFYFIVTYYYIKISILTKINNKLISLHFIFSEGGATKNLFKEAILERIAAYHRMLFFKTAKLRSKVEKIEEKLWEEKYGTD